MSKIISGFSVRRRAEFIVWIPPSLGRLKSPQQPLTLCYQEFSGGLVALGVLDFMSRRCLQLKDSVVKADQRLRSLEAPYAEWSPEEAIIEHKYNTAQVWLSPHHLSAS